MGFYLKIYSRLVVVDMSGGGRVQLTAVGSQDIMLTSNPQMSYFLKNYKQYYWYDYNNKELRRKGYIKNNKDIGYEESYWPNVKGIKYIV